MKLIWLIMIVTLMHQSKINDIPVKAKKLRLLYNLSNTGSAAEKSKNRRKFFNEFPKTFKELNDLYGYENDRPAMLYYDADKHILSLFNNLNNIDNNAYYRKIIKIAIGGHWEADAINYFQDGLNTHVENNPKLTVTILKEMDDKAVSSFWYFYFDGPHPEKQIKPVLLKIKILDNKVYDLMVNAHHSVLKNVDH